MFGLSFLAPLFLAGALAAAVPIVLHLLRREEAPEVALATTRFIKHAPVPRAKRRRLRDLLLLALRVLVLLLVAAAFARPYFAATIGVARTAIAVLAIDTSFSMGGVARQQDVQRAALAALERIPEGTAIAVLTFDDEARIISEASTDRGLARAAIERTRAGFGATNFQALTTAASAAFGGRPGSLVVVSDLQRSGWSAGRGSLPESVDLRVEAVPPVTRNVSVRRLTRVGDRIVVAVDNHGSRAEATTVSLTINADAPEAKPVSVPPGRTGEVTFDRVLPPKGVAIASVADEGGVPADDRRFLSLDPPPPVSVRVLAVGAPGSEPGFFVSRALAVADPQRPITVSSLGGPSGDGGSLTSDQIVVVLAARVLERQTRSALAEHVAGGGRAFIALGPTLDVSLVSELVGQESGVRVLERRVPASPFQLTPTEVRHPVFRGFGDATSALSRVNFTRAYELQAGTATVLARFTDGRPALLETVKGRGRLLLLASDLDGAWNDFPRRAAFVPFLQEVVRYLAQGLEGPREITVADLRQGVAREPGVFTPEKGGDVRVANVSVEESSVLVATVDEFGREIERTAPAADVGTGESAQQQEDEQAVWRYGLWAAIAVLVVESLVGRLWG